MEVSGGTVNCRGRDISEMTKLELQILIINLTMYHAGNQAVKQAWDEKAETVDLSRHIIEIDL